MSNKLNLANAEFIDGEWWYMLHGKPRQRLSTHNKRNKGRMYVAEAKPEYKDGYIPKGTRKDRDPQRVWVLIDLLGRKSRISQHQHDLTRAV